MNYTKMSSFVIIYSNSCFLIGQDTSGLPAYEYEAEMEERYMQSLVKTFKKTLADALFQFIIVDCYNIRLTHLVELHASSKQFNYYVGQIVSWKLHFHKVYYALGKILLY